MNKNKLNALAKVIEEAPKDTFDMLTFFTRQDEGDEGEVTDWDVRAGSISHTCGSAGCIAGWAVSTFLPPGVEVDRDSIEEVAYELLEADDVEEKHLLNRLFNASSYWMEQGYDVWGLSGITQEMAATELRRLAAE